MLHRHIDTLAVSAGRTHAALVLVALTVAAFVVSPNRVSDYREAQDELVALRSLPSAEFVDNVIQSLADRHEPDRFLEHRLLAYSHHDSLYQIERLFVVGWEPLPDVERFGWPSENSPVADHVEFFATPTVVAEVVPSAMDLTQLQAALMRELALSQRPVPANAQIIRLSIRSDSPGARLSGSHWVARGDPPESVRVSVVLVDPPEVKDPWAYGASAASRAAITFLPKGRYAVEWLRTRPGAQVLRAESDSTSFCRALRHVWDHVAHQTPAEASRTLDELVRSSENSLSAFGVAVDDRTVVMGGPLVLLGLVWLLFVKVRNLGLAVTLPDGTRAPVAWLGASRDWASQITTLLSVMLLPSVVTGLCVGRASGGGRMLLVACLLLTVLISWYTLRRTRQL